MGLGGHGGRSQVVGKILKSGSYKLIPLTSNPPTVGYLASFNI